MILCLCKHTVHFAKHESVDDMSAVLDELRKLAQNATDFPLHHYNSVILTAEMRVCQNRKKFNYNKHAVEYGLSK